MCVHIRSLKIRRGDFQQTIFTYISLCITSITFIITNYFSSKVHYTTLRNLLMADWSRKFSTLDQSTQSHPNYESYAAAEDSTNLSEIEDYFQNQEATIKQIDALESNEVNIFNPSLFCSTATTISRKRRLADRFQERGPNKYLIFKHCSIAHKDTCYEFRHHSNEECYRIWQKSDWVSLESVLEEENSTSSIWLIFRKRNVISNLFEDVQIDYWMDKKSKIYII